MAGRVAFRNGGSGGKRCFRAAFALSVLPASPATRAAGAAPSPPEAASDLAHRLGSAIRPLHSLSVGAPARGRMAFLWSIVLVAGGSSPASAEPGTKRPAATVQASAAAHPNQSPGSIMNRDIAKRFPGAALLDEAEFTSTVVGRRFRYREVGSELVVNRPKEVFVGNGRYQIHWSRSISYGAYKVKHGVISIYCPDCPYAFLDLGIERIFFRHEGKLFTAKADGRGRVVHLIEET